jgi:hypothetical protein
MSPRKTLQYALAATLATALMAAPASAMPYEPPGTGGAKAEQDMHASTVHPPAVHQDMRGEATTDGGGSGAVAKSGGDLRGEAAATGGTATADRGGPVRTPRLEPPTWPAYPTPLPRPADAPVAVDGGDDDGNLPLVLLVVAGTAALIGGAALAASRMRTGARVAH